MAQVDENFVGTNETVTVMEEIGNSTRNATDHSVTSYDDDTVSAILIPLAIIGVLIVGAAVVSCKNKSQKCVKFIIILLDWGRYSLLSEEKQQSKQGDNSLQYIILWSMKRVGMSGNLSSWMKNLQNMLVS